MALTDDPLGTIEVSIARESGDQDITVPSGALLTFDSSNYSTPQTVTLQAADDEDKLNGVARIIVTADGFLSATLTALEEDDEPYPNVLFVDDDAAGAGTGMTWNDAFTDLQQALEAIASKENFQFNEIRVAQGDYTPAPPSGNRAATFQLINGVAVKGGYAGIIDPNPNTRDAELYATILSGDLNGDDTPEPDSPSRDENSYHIVTANGADMTAVLDGVTITGGNADGTFPGGSGAAFFNNQGSPTLIGCTFTANSAADSGAAIYNSQAEPTLINCDFIANSSTNNGGAIFNYDSSAALTNCTFEDNSSATGGAMFNLAASAPTLTYCTFRGNEAAHGGAIYNQSSNPALTYCLLTENSASNSAGAIFNSDSSPTLTNCVVNLNSSGFSGGGLFNSAASSPVLTNCLISANSAQNQGGAIFNSDAGPLLINCTLSGNTASVTGGMFNFNDSSPTVTNSIFWKNTHDYGTNEFAQIYTDSGTPTVTFSCIQDEDPNDSYIPFGGSDNNNMDDDPRFAQDPDDGGDGWGDDPDTPDSDESANDEYGNLHILSGSPCIDAGNNAALPNDTADLDDDGDTMEPIPFDLDRIPRLFDDPAAPDSGSGTPPLVDMGAYELVLIM